MKVAILLAFTCAIMTAKLVKGAAIKAPLKIISLKDITPLERETLRFLDQQYKQEREKRSGSEDLFTQLKHKLAAGVKAKVSEIAQASVSKIGKASSSGRNFDHYDIPESYDHKSFDYLSLKKSILNTLLQAVKAIKGGIIALKGQIVKGSGFLLSAKGKLLSAKGESITHLGKNIASSALLSPHSHHSGHDDHHHDHAHYGPPLIYGAPSSPGAHYIHPSGHGHEHVHHDVHAGKLPLSGILILKKIPHGVRDIESHYSHHAAVEHKIPHFKPIKHSGPGIGEILVKFLKASASLKPGDPAPFTDEDFHPKHHHDEHSHDEHLHDVHPHDEHHHIDYPPFPDGHHPVQHVHNLDEILAFYKPLISTHEHHVHHDDERDPRHHDLHHHLSDDDHHYHDDNVDHAHHDIDHSHHHHDIDHAHHDIDHTHHDVDHTHHDLSHEHHDGHHSDSLNDQLANLDILEQYYAALTAQKNPQDPVETHEHHYHDDSSDGKPKPPGTSYGTPFEDPPGYLDYDELSSPSKKYPKTVAPSGKRTRKRVPHIYHLKPPKSHHHKPPHIHMHQRPYDGSRPYSKKKLPTSYDTPISSVQNVHLTASANMQDPQTYDDLASRFNFPVRPVSSAPSSTQNNQEINYQVVSGANSNSVSSGANNYQPSFSSPSSLSSPSPSSFSPPSRGNFPNKPSPLRLNMHHHRQPSPFETIPSITYQLGPNGPMRI